MKPEKDPFSPAARRHRQMLLIATGVLVILPLVLAALSILKLF